MEKQLFDCEGWDQLDTATFSFSDITLKQKIGNFEAGTKFGQATISFEDGTLALLTLTPEGEIQAQYDFKLTFNVIPT